MARVRGDTSTGDLFGEGTYFPVRAPIDLPKSMDMKRNLATAMAEAIRMSGFRTPVVAALMTEILGDDEVTPAQLYAYTSEARTTHTISIIRFKAFVRATQCFWLWDHLLQDEGCIVLQGEEALLAEATLKEKQAQRLLAEAKAAREAAPITTEFRVPRARRA
ncbi:MAG: hypothetical protein ABS77_13400 [Phenylobacterium sp. SCN 69-14]|nr:MAG: hypothetical protein ABS77_13400 [Phenylobacterium sp. SCN 69-14]